MRELGVANRTGQNKTGGGGGPSGGGFGSASNSRRKMAPHSGNESDNSPSTPVSTTSEMETQTSPKNRRHMSRGGRPGSVTLADGGPVGAAGRSGSRGRTDSVKIGGGLAREVSPSPREGGRSSSLRQRTGRRESSDHSNPENENPHHRNDRSGSGERGGRKGSHTGEGLAHGAMRRASQLFGLSGFSVGGGSSGQRSPHAEHTPSPSILPSISVGIRPRHARHSIDVRALPSYLGRKRTSMFTSTGRVFGQFLTREL